MSEPEDDELKPCPMCGWQPDTAAYQFKTEIFCGNEGCGACRIVVDADDTPEHGLEAIARWNRRAAASTSTEAAPVAWRYKQPGWNYWKTTAIEPINQSFIVEPLFLTPPTPKVTT